MVVSSSDNKTSNQKSKNCSNSSCFSHSGDGFGAPLGIVTKTSSPLTPTGVSGGQKIESIDQKTGEILSYKIDQKGNLKGKASSSGEARANRWALKSVVNKLYRGSRTAGCMVLRAPVKGADGKKSTGQIELCRGKDTGKAYYHGLMSCGSVWGCPICAAKISERRRNELHDALQIAKSEGYGIHFVTLTFPHGVGDDLKVIRKKMAKAYGRLNSGKYSVKLQLKDLCPDYEFNGYIRAVEVTHGKNGFHPHLHMIVFTSKNVTSSTLKDLYLPSWQRACRLAGLPVPDNEHGCTVQDGSKANEYVSKWGLEEEMTKANHKVSARKGMTPWGFLKAILDGDNEDYPPKRAEALFRVYLDAFKGQRQLYWSNGLRKLLELKKDVSDEEIAAQREEEEFSVLAYLTVEQWRKIRKVKCESALLDLAELRPEEVKDFIKNICSPPGSLLSGARISSG